MPPDLIGSAQGAEWTGRFREIGALWEANTAGGPHVKTSLGGAHVDKYFNSDVVLASPSLTTEIIDSSLVPQLSRLGVAPDWVISYAPFGLFLVHAVAQALGARCAYANPSDDYATHFQIAPSDSVLVIADDVYSGGSILKVVERMRQSGAEVVPVLFCLANMSGAQRLDGHEIISAAALSAERFEAEACPLCAAGSSALLPRPNWHALCASARRGPGAPAAPRTT